MGYFDGGAFNLSVSLRYAPAPQELNFWCQVFNLSSRIMSDLTDGAQRIGTVLLSTNSMGGGDADIWIHPNADVWPNSTSARLWISTESMDTSQDFGFYPTILAHELSHYLYDLRDEYNNGSVCLGNVSTGASMMEGYPWTNYTRWTDGLGNDFPDFATFFPAFSAGTAQIQVGEPSEYCHAGNHNATANNNQNNLNGNQSCWTYIANDANHNGIPYGLTTPGAGGPAGAEPPLPTPTTCTELIPVQRFVLVLDRSGSMAGAKFTQLKVGANFWVDYVNPLEEFAVVTYSSGVTTDIPRSEVPADPPTASTWRDDRHAIVDAFTDGGMTAIGDALRTGLNAITAGGRASSQVMILFTDGLQNAGTETAEEVLPDLIAAGVRVYTIGLGGDQDAALLSTVATTTGGTYFPISGDLSPDAAAAAITEALVLLAGESRENGGMVSFNDVDGASVDDEVDGDTGTPFAGPADEKQAQGDKDAIRAFRFPVAISRGSRHCTLGALFKNRGRFTVRVFDPDGNAVSPGPTVRRVRNRYPYSFYEIDNPQPGTWQVEVSGSGIRTSRFRTIGFEVNDVVRFEASAVPSFVPLGGSVLVRARLSVPEPVPGLRVRGQVRTPFGRWQTLSFAPDQADPTLMVATLTTSDRERGQYLVVVDGDRRQGNVTLELDELYRQRPGLKPADMTRTVAVPKVRRRTVLGFVADKPGMGEGLPVAGFNKVPPTIPKGHDRDLVQWKKKHGHEPPRALPRS
ncbi:MAG: vWA domain-containing protein [Gaiellales bacterium]